MFTTPGDIWFLAMVVIWFLCQYGGSGISCAGMGCKINNPGLESQVGNSGELCSTMEDDMQGVSKDKCSLLLGVKSYKGMVV